MRTIDDIIPPSRRRERETFTNESANRAPGTPRQPSRFPYKTLVGVLLVIAISLAALYYFSSALVEITPTTVSAAVQGSFTASQSTGNLPYQIITTQKIASQSVPGKGTQAVHSSATGSITVYNTQSKAQRLITNTRFATTAGLIFRIHQSVTVPKGSSTNPGSISVKVYADKEGDSYNVGPTSFTVPGFAGTPQENEVYARSSTSMSGGASGTIPVVDPTVESETKQALIAALTPQLAASLQGQIPPGYLLLEGAATTTYQELTPAPSTTTGMVEVKEQGTITAIIFPNAELAKTIATAVPNLNYQGEPLTLLPKSNLQFSVTTLPSANASSFSFTLSGTASFVYTVDSTRIAAAVAGKTRSEAEVALTSYPEVKRAIITLRPFWRQAFPQDPSAIKVTVVNP